MRTPVRIPTRVRVPMSSPMRVPIRILMRVPFRTSIRAPIRGCYEDVRISIRHPTRIFLVRSFGFTLPPYPLRLGWRLRILALLGLKSVWFLVGNGGMVWGLLLGII